MKGMWLCPGRWLPGMVKIWPWQRQFIVYWFAKNPRLKSGKEEREKEEIEKKCKEYYEAHMKEETERLNKLVDWYKFKLDEIREAPVDSRPRKLEKLYQISEKNKHLGVMTTRAGTLNPGADPVQNLTGSYGNPKNSWSPQSGKKNFVGMLGGSGDMSQCFSRLLPRCFGKPQCFQKHLL